jgi:sulfate/thiosulfate transport system permease protein
LSFCRAISEYGSLVLLSGNLPYSTEVASVRIMSSIEGDKLTEAAAVASILLVVALIVIITLDLISRRVARYA